MIFGFFFFSGATISRPPIEVQISADSYLRERISSFTFLPFFLQFLTSLTFPGLRIFLNTSFKGKIPHFAQKQDHPEWMKFYIWLLWISKSKYEIIIPKESLYICGYWYKLVGMFQTKDCWLIMSADGHLDNSCSWEHCSCLHAIVTNPELMLSPSYIDALPSISMIYDI